MDQRKALGGRKFLMPLIFNENDIWIAPNEIFYTTANAAQMRGAGTFFQQKGIKYMGTRSLNNNDEKELKSMLPNFQLKVLQGWIRVHSTQSYTKKEVIFPPYTYYGSFGHFEYPVLKFATSSQAT